MNTTLNNKSNDDQRDLASDISKKDSNYIYIYDIIENTVQYITSSFQRLTGYPTLEVTRDFLEEIIHKNDLSYVLKCEEKCTKFSSRLSFEEHFNYVFIYSYRVKTLPDTYIRILQEAQALEVDNDGKLSKMLITHKRIEDYNKRPKDDFKIYDKSLNLCIQQKNIKILTKRELEILLLIKKGMCSREISETLNISNDTVRTHRKNILNKSNCNSFIELLKKLSYSL